MRIYSSRRIAESGKEQIVVEVSQPEIVPVDCTTPDMWENGGLYVSFEINYIMGHTEATCFSIKNGQPNYLGIAKTWKNEVLTEDECLRFCEKEFGNATQ